MGYIYKTTDLTNNLIYIGQKTSNKFLGIKYVGSGRIIVRIIRKCKKNNIRLDERFKVELLEECNSAEELDEREIFWIKEYNSTDKSIGYNIAPGGLHGGPLFKGHTHSEATKEYMSKSRMGENNANYGNRWNQSDELKALHSKLSSGENNGMYGKKQSDQQKSKSRASHVGRQFYSNIELDKVVCIKPDEVQHYLDLGYIKGNIHARVYKHKK